MSKGRPRATYADAHLRLASQVVGRWSVLPEHPQMVDKIVRKLRREGLQAKSLVLDDEHALVATRWEQDADPEVAP